MVEPQVLCDICKDSFTIDNFRFLLNCGHGFHQQCLRNWAKQRNRYTCATCRSETSQEPIQIYVTFAEPTVAEQQSVADGVDKIDADSSADTLRRSIRKIKKEAKVAEESTPGPLLDAIRRLEKRLHPVFIDLARERDEKVALLEELNSLRNRLKELEPTCSRISHLQEELRTANLHYETAVASAENAKHEALRERKRRKESDESLERYKRALKRKTEELQQAEALLKSKDNHTRALRTKLKALAKEGKRPNGTQDPDDSLQVEQPVGVTDDVDKPRKRSRTATLKKRTGD